MAGFNPFAPQLEGQQKAPQLQGHQAPNTPMQDKPGFMDKYGTTIASQAMQSDEAGAMKDWGVNKAKEAWNAFSPASPDVIPVSELSNVGAQTAAQTATDAALVNGMGSGMAAGAAPIAAGVDAGLATAAATAEAAAAAEAAALTTAATTGGTVAAGTVAGAAPLALAAGPFAPLVLGGMMLAANSGK